MCITPGPWRVDGHAEDLMPREIVKDFPTKGECGLVCELTHSLFRENQRDNARLIAAAPDLLTACKGALAALSQSKTFPADVEYAIWCLSHAIAKAEGR